jgi:hypothetical protein
MLLNVENYVDGWYSHSFVKDAQLKLLWGRKTCKINKLILFLQNMENKQNQPTQFYVDPCRVPKKKSLKICWTKLIGDI